jgi:hypothetical protein
MHISKAIAINYNARGYEILHILNFRNLLKLNVLDIDQLLAKTLIDLITTIPQKSAIKL